MTAAPPQGDDRRDTLVRWRRPNRVVVTADEPIRELETGKAAAEVPAGAAGVLRHLAREGDVVAVGDAVARIDPPS